MNDGIITLSKAECEIALRWLDVTRLYAFVESEDNALAAALNAAIAGSSVKVCQQQLRDEGFPYMRTCEICGFGPCPRKPGKAGRSQ